MGTREVSLHHRYCAICRIADLNKARAAMTCNTGQLDKNHTQLSAGIESVGKVTIVARVGMLMGSRLALQQMCDRKTWPLLSGPFQVAAYLLMKDRVAKEKELHRKFGELKKH
jgi:hypothetical protein